jgi:hypothetical protein
VGGDDDGVADNQKMKLRRVPTSSLAFFLKKKITIKLRTG